MKSLTIKNEYLFEIICVKGATVKDIIIKIASANTHLNYVQLQMIECKIQKNFIGRFNSLWNSSNRTKENFVKRNSVFLKRSQFFLLTEPVYKQRVGHPKKMFDDCSARTKRRKVMECINQHGESCVKQAAIPLIKAANDDSVEDTTEDEPIYYVIKALALFVDLKLTRSSYERLRAFAIMFDKDIGKKMFPAYKQLARAKLDCYPKNIVMYLKYFLLIT